MLHGGAIVDAAELRQQIIALAGKTGAHLETAPEVGEVTPFSPW